MDVEKDLPDADDAPEALARRFDESRAVLPSDPVGRFMAEARRHPRLDADEERRLAMRARRGDVEASHKLVLHNLWLVVAVALRYHGAWSQLIDLVQEGTIGLMEAVRRWETRLGARFGTYAAYWIRAHILRFILSDARLVSIAHTRAGRKLFFRLEKERRQLLAEGFEPTPRLLASRLDVSEREVSELVGHLDAPEVSIDAPQSDEAGPAVDRLPASQATPEEIAADKEFRVLLGGVMARFATTLDDARERAVWHEHLMADEPAPLAALGERFGVSKQRMGQIAAGLKQRFRADLAATVGPDADITWRADLDVSDRNT